MTSLYLFPEWFWRWMWEIELEGQLLSGLPRILSVMGVLEAQSIITLIFSSFIGKFAEAALSGCQAAFQLFFFSFLTILCDSSIGLVLYFVLKIHNYLWNHTFSCRVLSDISYSFKIALKVS